VSPRRYSAPGGWITGDDAVDIGSAARLDRLRRQGLDLRQGEVVARLEAAVAAGKVRCEPRLVHWSDGSQEVRPVYHPGDVGALFHLDWDLAPPAPTVPIVVAADTVADAGPVPSRSVNKGGAPTKADWSALKDELRDEIKAVGFPHRGGEPGWQSNADAERFVAARTGKDDPSPRTVRRRTKEILEQLRQEEWAKTVPGF